MNNPPANTSEIQFCACCGRPLAYYECGLHNAIHMLDCENDGDGIGKPCKAYKHTTTTEGYFGMIERFHLTPLYDTATGERLTLADTITL